MAPAASTTDVWSARAAHGALAITSVHVTPAAARAAGPPKGLNSPQQLPQIGAELAALRGIAPELLAQASLRNAVAALPKLGPLLAPYTGSLSQALPHPP